MLTEIFVPQDDYLSDKVASIKSRFGIVDSVIGTIDVIKDFLDTVALGAPPKVEVHLENAEGSVNYGDTAYALDMSWYDRYKPIVDVLLSSMIWVFFVWRVFVRLPNIINGVGSGVDDIAKTGKGR